ncbi:MAG: hypothetical protein ACM36C_02320 [Acidobacteriota bacterium]
MKRGERLIAGLVGGAIVALLVCIGGPGNVGRYGSSMAHDDTPALAACLPYRAPLAFAAFAVAIYWLLGRRRGES